MAGRQFIQNEKETTPTWMKLGFGDTFGNAYAPASESFAAHNTTRYIPPHQRPGLGANMTSGRGSGRVMRRRTSSTVSVAGGDEGRLGGDEGSVSIRDLGGEAYYPAEDALSPASKTSKSPGVIGSERKARQKAYATEWDFGFKTPINQGEAHGHIAGGYLYGTGKDDYAAPMGNYTYGHNTGEDALMMHFGLGGVYNGYVYRQPDISQNADLGTACLVHGITVSAASASTCKYDSMSHLYSRLTFEGWQGTHQCWQPVAAFLQAAPVPPAATRSKSPSLSPRPVNSLP
jgi:hypothetical protein